MADITILHDGKEIVCTVVRSYRSSLAIRVLGKNRITIAAPILFPDFLIRDFLKKKSSWIRKRLRFFETHTSVSEYHYLSGEHHWYLGKLYTLHTEISDTEDVRVENSTIIVKLPRISPILVKSALRRFYHDRGVEILYGEFESAKADLAHLGLIPKSLTYKRMKGKWGSCSHDNHIVLNPELVKTPIACIRYVIYHELCHIRHHNHGPGFHALMSDVMPDWKKQRTVLNTFDAHY